MLAALVLVFDMTMVLALMYPGRERVEVKGTNGETYVYACKPGAAGETPQEQAAKAQTAFEESTAKFAEFFVGRVMQDAAEEASRSSSALTLTLQTSSWARTLPTRLEKEYGCALLG